MPAIPFLESVSALKGVEAIERKESDGQVQRDPEVGGDGGESEQHRVLLRMRPIHRVGRPPRGACAQGVLAAARGDGRCGDKVRHLPREGVPRARQGSHRPREDRLRAPQAGDDDVASLERVLRFRRRQGRGALHVLGVLQEAPRMGAAPRRPHANRPQARGGHTGRLGRGHRRGRGSRHGGDAEGLRVRGVPALLQLPLRRGVLQDRRGGVGPRPCPYVRVLRRRDPDSRARQLQDGRRQEHEGRAHRQRAVQAHERALRLRRGAGPGAQAPRQGQRRDGRRHHRASGDDGAAQQALHVALRVQPRPHRPGGGDKLPPLPEARGQQGEHLPRPGEADAHPAAGEPLRDVRPQGGHRQF